MQDTRRALMVWGGWPGHEPEQTTHRFAEYLENQHFDVRITTSLDAFLERDTLQHVDLIVLCYSMGELSNEQESGLLQAVQGGVGLAGWHGGLVDAFRNNPAFHFMVGGQFVAHPGGVIRYRVNIADPDDPITVGLRDFTMQSEQYYLHVDPANHVLATTTFDAEHAPWIGGTVMPVAWTRSFGSGHVFYCSLGHANADFDVPEAETIVQRGLLWASR